MTAGAAYVPPPNGFRTFLIVWVTQSISVFGSALAFNGAVTHIFNHAFAKGLFFLVAGALSYTTGTRSFPALSGILQKNPLVGVGFGVAALIFVNLFQWDAVDCGGGCGVDILSLAESLQHGFVARNVGHDS